MPDTSHMGRYYSACDENGGGSNCKRVRRPCWAGRRRWESSISLMV